MGYVGDVLDRNKAMTLTLSIACLAAVASAALPTGPPSSVYITIIICRFILGAGLGGVYPLSAAKAAEDAPPDEQEVGPKMSIHVRSPFDNKIGLVGFEDVQSLNSVGATTAVSNLKAGTRRSAMAFFWQIPGSMTPWALAYFFSYLDLSVDSQWRLLLGLGSIPAAFVVILLGVEMTYAEQKSKVIDTKQDAISSPDKVSSILASEQLAAIFHAAFRSKVIWFKVLYTGGSWFLYDVCFCEYCFPSVNC